MLRKLSIGLISLLVLAACSSGTTQDPAKTVEQYLQAKVNKDAAALRRLLCSSMEADLERESKTFDSVSGVHLEGMSCARDGNTTTVRCTGKIVALYGTEQTEFPLVSYRVVQEDGEWKWCGEAP